MRRGPARTKYRRQNNQSTGGKIGRKRNDQVWVKKRNTNVQERKKGWGPPAADQKPSITQKKNAKMRKTMKNRRRKSPTHGEEQKKSRLA